MIKLAISLGDDYVEHFLIIYPLFQSLMTLSGQ